MCRSHAHTWIRRTIRIAASRKELITQQFAKMELSRSINKSVNVMKVGVNPRLFF